MTKVLPNPTVENFQWTFIGLSSSFLYAVVARRRPRRPLPPGPVGALSSHIRQTKSFLAGSRKLLKNAKTFSLFTRVLNLLLFLQFGKNGCTGIKFQCSNLAINILRSSKRTRKTIVLFRNTTKTLRHWQQNSPPSTDKTASVKSGRHTSQPPEKSPTQGTDNRERPHQTP